MTPASVKFLGTHPKYLVVKIRGNYSTKKYAIEPRTMEEREVVGEQNTKRK